MAGMPAIHKGGFQAEPASFSPGGDEGSVLQLCHRLRGQKDDPA